MIKTHLEATADELPPPSSLLGIQKIQNVLKPFEIEFGPLIAEIDAKEKVIRDCADNATMVRIKGEYPTNSSPMHTVHKGDPESLS